MANYIDISARLAVNKRAVGQEKFEAKVKSVKAHQNRNLKPSI
jgi:hypothetical protein